MLMDSVVDGSELDVEPPNGGGLPEQAPVPIAAGRWQVTAAHVRRNDMSVGVVRLLPVAQAPPGQ